MDTVLDLSILAALVGPDPAKLQRFLHKFIDSTAAGLLEMNTCLERGDLQRIRDLGHRIKSAARVVGALGMGELCEHLERIPPDTPSAELAQAADLLARLAALFEQVRAAAAPVDPATR